MEDFKTKAENLSDHVGEYVETYLKLTGIKVTEKATGFATVSLVGVLVCFLILCILFFVGIGGALWVGEALQNEKAGYFTVAGFYVVLTILLILLRDKLIFPFLRNFIIKKVYE